MKRTQLLSSVGALACLVISIAVMGYGRSTALHQELGRQKLGQELPYVELADGRLALVDATGRAVPLQRYERIIAGSIVARAALGELCEQQRIVAVIAAGLDQAIDAHRFAGIPRLQDMKDVEAILTLQASLVLVNSVGSLAHVERLRESGLEVFALGEMRGVNSFLRDLRQVAALIGEPERGERTARGFMRRMRAVAGDVPEGARKRGMYLSVYASQLFGGTVGTSYHDILTYGGLMDAAAANFKNWPQYRVEQVFAVDPAIVVATEGAGAVLCRKEPLARLRACQDGRSGFVELPASWLEDPSFVMLNVAEAIRDAVYGSIESSDACGGSLLCQGQGPATPPGRR